MIDHHVYAIVTDGDLMEGVASESASLAGHLKLGKLIYFYDDNRISIDGSTDLTFTEDRAKRFEAYGWHVSHVNDSFDIDALVQAVEAAKADPRPSLIIVRTKIGQGLPTVEGTAGAHGNPPGWDEIDQAKQNVGWPVEPRFYIPDDVREHFNQDYRRSRTGNNLGRTICAIHLAYPELAVELRRRMRGFCQMIGKTHS